MTKSKSPAKAAKATASAIERPPVSAPAPTTSAEPFSSKELMRLLRINRFLVKVADPALARARTKVAYTTDDHQEGWRLYRVAAGEGFALEVGAVTAPTGGAHVGLLQHLDDFENKWFPRARRIIERFAPAAHREALVEAFFRDLQQQPLGPLVVGSVSTFLDRVEALEKSDAPGAAKVRAVLADRGIDAAHVARLRKTLDEARSLKQEAARTVGDPTAALRARRAAYDELWLWWKDWRETFHSEVDGRQRRELGLVDTSLRGGTEVDEGEDPVDDPVTPPEE
jgi:hypothetical protein